MEIQGLNLFFVPVEVMHGQWRSEEEEEQVRGEERRSGLRRGVVWLKLWTCLEPDHQAQVVSSPL
jgi:hypothetical protein